MAKLNKRKLCSTHGFYNAIESPSCPLCKKQTNKTYDTTLRAKDRQKIYNSKKWKTVREQAILRDLFKCQECKRNGIDTQGEEVDHIVELSDDISLAYELSNLQFLCKACHSKKTYKEKTNRAKN